MTSTVVRVVVFAALALGVTVGLALQLPGVSLASRYPLHATFDDVVGMRVGDQVRIAGVPVGAVEAIAVRDGRAAVTLGLDPGVTVPADSTAVAGFADLLGTRRIDLEPGRAAAHLAPDDTIARTTARGDVGRLVQELGPLARALDPAQLNALVGSAHELLERNDDELIALVTDGRALVDTVAARAEAIERMLADQAVVARTFADRERDVRRVVADLVTLAETFAGPDGPLVTALDDTADAIAAADDLLRANEHELGELLDGLTEVVGQAHARRDDFEAALIDLPNAMTALFAVVRHGEYLRVDGTCFGPFPAEQCPALRRNGIVPGEVVEVLDLLLGEVMQLARR